MAVPTKVAAGAAASSCPTDSIDCWFSRSASVLITMQRLSPSAGHRADGVTIRYGNEMAKFRVSKSRAGEWFTYRRLKLRVFAFISSTEPQEMITR
jgi:hypothetical protein